MKIKNELINITLALLALVGVFVNQAVGEEFPVTARLFVGTVASSPNDVNTEMRAVGLHEFDAITQYGVEATYPLMKLIDIGLRYTKRTAKVLENPEDLTTEYDGEISQDSVSAVLRVPLIRGQIVRFDLFGAFGGANTVFKLKSATQDGELDKKSSDGPFGSVVTNFGASLGFGYKGFYVVFEGGVETNKMDSFKYTGNINNNIQELNISGSYFTLGLMFDGVKASKQ